MNALKKFLLPLVAAMAGFLFGACTTPAARIRQNPAQFAAYSPEEQELIKQGKLAIGFDTDAVRLALGAPDHVSIRESTDGASQVWSYVTYETAAGLPLYRGWYHRYYMWGDPIYPWYAGYPTRREHEHFRVIFDRAGRVSAIERDVT